MDFHLPCQRLKSAWMRGLATRRFALQISDPFKNPWRDFHLPCQRLKSAWMRGLAACRIAQRFCNTQENPWRDFPESYARLEWRQGCLQPVAVPAREWSAKARNHGKRVTKGLCSRLQSRNEWQSKKTTVLKNTDLITIFHLN